MAEYTITLVKEKRSFKSDETSTLLDALIRADAAPDAPCGGHGTCGKCLVLVKSAKYNGVQKACQIHTDCDMEVDTSLKATGHSLLTTGVERKIPIMPMIQHVTVTGERCRVGNSDSEWELLKQALARATGRPEKDFVASPAVISSIYPFMEAHDREAEVILCKNTVLELAEKGTRCYLAAFDIGTTSVVGYLLDSVDGKQLAVSSRLNPQSQYGADVIARSDHVLNNNSGDVLAGCIRQALNEMTGELAKSAGISRTQIYQIAIVGNTCMHHLFLNISPASLVHAPYNPAVRENIICRARDVDIEAHPEATVLMLSNIAGFVGADTVGCLIACDMEHREKMTLMIDIGTNGEMVLGNKKRMITCSTAAGPAFEGAKIACGMRGAKGAIDHIEMKDNKVVYSTIGDEEAIGICGSGLMDIVAMLLKEGFIEDTGRLMDPDELETPGAVANQDRIIKVEGKNAFKITDKVYLTQKDIGEVQQAKAAIAAGIILLSKKMGIAVEDIEEILIAGAFGNYMRAASACRIGLLPAKLYDRIHMIGNAAGEGARIAVLNEPEYDRSGSLHERVEFLELAADPDFNDTYVDELMFLDEEDYGLL